MSDDATEATPEEAAETLHEQALREGWDEVRNAEQGDVLTGWLVPQPSGGKLFRTAPGQKHPKHKAGPGRPKKRVRERLTRMLDEHVIGKLEDLLEEGLVCASCKRRMPHRLSVPDLLSLLDKAAKHGMPAIEVDDEGLRGNPVVILPAQEG